MSVGNALSCCVLQKKFVFNINNILGVNKVNKIAVAVSGGVDSVALLHLVLEWSRVNDIEVTVFSVDHNLRAESKLEISYIKKLSTKYGFHFVPLSWTCGDKITAIQERARKARYELINEGCKRFGISLLLTAHHLDDMLETYLIKRSKKSSDLALIPNITYFQNNLWVVRPLFNVEKKELIDYLLLNNISWFEDESNKLDKYERNRVRKKLEVLSPEEKVTLLGEYNVSIDRAKWLNKILIQAIAEVVSIYNYGFAKIDITKFRDLDAEIKIHIINYVLTMVSGKTVLPRYRNVINIISSIADNSFKSSTLSHCKLIAKNGEIVIYKEKAFVGEGDNLERKDASGAAMPHCYISHWDNRFEIILDNPGYTVSNLAMDEYICLKKHLNLKKLAKDSNNSHKSILFTLPIIKNLEKVVAIPHISYYDSEILSGVIKVIFKPNFISRFTHFF